MTLRQIQLVNLLRFDLLRSNYPKIYAINNEVLEAVECYLEKELNNRGEAPILKCGKNGLFFKGIELVLEVK